MLYILVCGPQVMAKLQLFTADCVVHIGLWSSGDGQATVVYGRLYVVYIGLWSSGDGWPGYSCLQQTVCCTYWSGVMARLLLFTADCVVHIDLWSSGDD